MNKAKTPRGPARPVPEGAPTGTGCAAVLGRRTQLDHLLKQYTRVLTETIPATAKNAATFNLALKSNKPTGLSVKSANLIDILPRHLK